MRSSIAGQKALRQEHSRQTVRNYHAKIAELIAALNDDDAGHELSESYDLYCSTLESAIDSTYADSISHTKPDDDYLRVIEDVATAAAYQLIVKRRLKLRRERNSI